MPWTHGRPGPRTLRAPPLRAEGSVDRYENRWGAGPSFESAQLIHLRLRSSYGLPDGVAGVAVALDGAAAGGS